MQARNARRFGVACALAAAVSTTTADTSMAAKVTIEAENMQYVNGAQAANNRSKRFKSPKARNGMALDYGANGSAVKTVTVDALSAITLRARATRCGGAPKARVKLDRAAVGTLLVRSAKWANYRLAVSRRAGTYRVAVKFLNAGQEQRHGDRKCRRDLFLDRVTLNAATTAQAESRRKSANRTASTPTLTSTSNAGAMYVTPERLMTLPRSGTPYSNMLALANAAVSQINFSAATDCQLRNYENAGRYGQKALAAAFVARRTGNTTMRNFAVKCLQRVIGSETVGSTDGTSTADGLLASARNLQAYVVMADLIGLDKDRTMGVRSGWTTTSWRSWLSGVTSKVIGTHGRWKTIEGTAVNSGSNWGAAALGSWTAVALHLGQPSTRLLNQWRRWLGNPVGATANFVPTSSYNAGWDANPTMRFAINPESTSDPDKRGGVVEDASRGGGCCTIVGSGLSYSNEHLHFIVGGAIMLKNRGIPVHRWGTTDDGPSTFKAAGDYALRKGLWPRYGTSAIHNQLAHGLNALLGSSYPEAASPAAGRAWTGADWWG